MKAVILDGGRESTIFPLTNYCSKLELPIANEPLILHLLRFLKNSGITEIAIVSSDHLDFDTSLIKKLENYRENNVHLSYFVESIPRGTAGALKEIEAFIGSSHFLVIAGNVFPYSIDLSKILNFHLNRDSGVTVVVEEKHGEGEDFENIEVDADGVVKKFNIPYHLRNKQGILRPRGLYVFNPKVLEYINQNGYMDIKEQLIPYLNNKGIPVYAYKEKRSIRNINNLIDYFNLNREILENGFKSKGEIFNPKKELMDRIWVGENVEISPKAYLLGPVLIGDNCVIEDFSQIIGPTIIGSGSHIGKEVLIRESIIWSRAHLMNKSHIEYSLIGERLVIAKGEKVRNTVVIQDKGDKGKYNFISFNNDNFKASSYENSFFKPFSFNVINHKVYLSVKRLLDILLSALGLVILLPVFVIIAISIKMGSRGPVFFYQRRCGKEGKEFKMYKLRTMVIDAERLQKQLLEKNIVDGPMFKIGEDPRVAGVGRFLRMTSLDELPQLFNVLRGEMSMVGPRPLKMEEMAFSPSWRDIRLSVKPGITGLWQVEARSSGLFHDWIRYDVYYVKNQSLWLDIKILFKTIKVVLKKSGAY